MTYRSDWKKGSTYDVAYEESGLVVSDPEQVILESDPYRRLTYTWHTFTPEWADRHGFDEVTAAAWRAEPRSKVAFDIEEAGEGVVKLTVRPRRLRAGQRGARGHHERMAGRHRQPQDAAGDRVGLAERLSGGLPPSSRPPPPGAAPAGGPGLSPLAPARLPG